MDDKLIWKHTNSMNTFNSVTCPLKSASDIGCLICCVATAVFFGFRRTTFLSVAEEPSLQAMSCLRFSRSCLSLELRALQKYVCTVHNSFCQHVGTCIIVCSQKHKTAVLQFTTKQNRRLLFNVCVFNFYHNLHLCKKEGKSLISYFHHMQPIFFPEINCLF